MSEKTIAIKDYWKEKTKLDKRNKIMIGFYILMAIFEITVAIIEKNFTWIICALLWGNIALIEYCNAKILKGKEAIIDIQEEHIESQNKFINTLINEIAERDSRLYIDMNVIKIPKVYKKPTKIKLNERKEYFKNNKNFKVPIIIDKKYNLIDGYTSYLIAKQENFTKVEVRMV